MIAIRTGEKTDMFEQAKTHYQSQLSTIRQTGLYKEERIITTPQGARIDTATHKNLLNLCSNNYLGLSNNPEAIHAAQESYGAWGYGMSSVRFICGTLAPHIELERALSTFLETEGTILYSSCFDANGGLFETLFDENDAIISDELNHASIIDGVRLCKAARYRYKNNDMDDLEDKLKQAQNARIRIIATDGVFSMDGIVANLKGICELAEQYRALVTVDDSHAVGFMGKQGRGTPEYCGVTDRVDLITGTFGKALGGASGGYTSGRRELIELLRQRSRPYLFSNTLAPAITCATLKILEMLTASTVLRDKLAENTRYFRQEMEKAGFSIPAGEHPIVPILLGNASAAQEMARKMLDQGVYVTGFFYPVVPQGKARVRTQISAAHEKNDLDFAVDAFTQVRKQMRNGTL